MAHFVFDGCSIRDTGMYELVEKILWAVSFIAIGGALVVMFFLVFAQSILGSRSIHTQLENLLHQAEQMTEQLRQIVKHLEKEKAPPQKKP